MANSVLKILLQVSGDTKGAKDVTRELDGVLKSVTGFGLGSLTAAGLAGGLVAVVKSSVDAYAESEMALTKQTAVLRATGMAAGLTGKELESMARDMSSITGIPDETITNAQTVLLTFREIGNEVFPEAMQAAADMSVVMGGDLQGAILMVGKALQDPLTGLTALRRAGVSFNETQKQQIASLVKSNDLFGAQKIILGELKGEFGGVAEAAGDTTTGSINKLNNAVDDLKEALGSELAPDLVKIADGMTAFITVTDEEAAAQARLNAKIEAGSDVRWRAYLMQKLLAGGEGRLKDDFVAAIPPAQEYAEAIGGIAVAAEDYFKALKSLGGGQLGTIDLPALPEAKLWNLTKKVKELKDITGPTAGDQHALAQAIGDMTLSALNAKDPLFNLKLALGDLKSKQIYVDVFLRTFGATLTLAERQELATGGCFVQGSPIDVPAGKVPIEKMVVGDRVVCYVPRVGRRTIARVEKTFTTLRNDLVSVRTARGDIAGVSPEHPFLTEGGELVGAGSLLPGMFVVTRWGRAAVLEVAHVPGEHRVYNIEIDHPDHLYFVAGHVVHNKRIAGGSPDVPVGLHGVGEEGEEGLYVDENGKVMVISHPKWEMMKRMGIRPQGGFRMGGEVEDVYIPDTPSQPYPGWNPMDWTRPGAEAVGGGGSGSAAAQAAAKSAAQTANATQALINNQISTNSRLPQDIALAIRDVLVQSGVGIRY
jgi:hypothetical protein